MTAARDGSTHLELEWLGQLPAHWSIRRLKYLVRFRSDKLDIAPRDLPYIGLEHIESWTGRITTPEGSGRAEGAVARFSSSDVLFGKLRPYLAKAAAPTFNGVCSSELV